MHPQTQEEIRRAVHAELQQLGRFEAVPAPAELSEQMSEALRQSGRFSEPEMIALARCGGADVILFGTLTHYSPYQRQRIGLTLQAISPDLGQVVASVDGLWDSTDPDVADRARAYYRREKLLREKVTDQVLGRWEEAYAQEIVLDSPHLFQRFVSFEAVHLLVGESPIRPMVAQEPIWVPGTILLTVKAWIKDCCGCKNEPCPPTPPVEAKKDKAPANNATPQNEQRDATPVVPK
jgi:hypothetical protein